MKTYIKLGLGFLSIAVLLAANWVYSPHSSHDDEHDGVHYHAGFRVYIDGTLQDYSDYKYMNFVPCTEHNVKKSPAEEQIEKAHLHDSVGDVVHTHRAGATWGDLFKNIQVELPKDKGLKGYVDGKEVSDILNQPIRSYESVIFVVGESKLDHTQEKVETDHIKEVEAKSELCGKT